MRKNWLDLLSDTRLSKWERGLKNLHNLRVYREGNEDRDRTRPFRGGLR